ncbi:methyl-accepting chemotaxis sensory transducer [Beggiatoa sp. PS]|nr:methyl-accepting chemotaxis sensory transducer [Beggiatoa sp. PS]
MKKVSDMVIEIAKASEEQSLGIQQVNDVVLQLDEITQQNAALVEEAAVASESMKEQAQSLKERMSFFNSRKNSHSTEMNFQFSTHSSENIRNLRQPKESAPKSVIPSLKKQSDHNHWENF